MALGDDAEQPEFIETVAGAGYRFIAPVEIGQPAGEDVELSRARHLMPFVVAGLAVLVVGLIIFAPDTDHRIDRIAVLPLANLTGDPNQAYIVEGIHDALINRLGRLESVDVLSRTTTMAYGDAGHTLPELAGALAVDAVVEGSVTRIGQDISLSLQLMQVNPERQLWVDRIQRNIDDTYAIGIEAARALAPALGADQNLLVDAFPTSGQPVDPDAYDAYLKGRYDLERRSAEGFRKARDHYRRAMEIDPDFALPYVGLANVLGSSATFGLISPAEAYAEARGLAERAIELDPDLAYAHTVLAGVDMYWNWDWPAAERGLRRAITLNPNLPNPHRMIAEILSLTGRHDEAVAAMERSRELDPLAPMSRFKPI